MAALQRQASRLFFCRKGPLGPLSTLVSRPPSVLISRRAFSDFSDIDGTVIDPVPNSQKKYEELGYRIWPPHASWYTLPENPTWDPNHNPAPQAWDESKKSLKEHKGVLLFACDKEGANESEKKLIMAIAMLETDYMWGRDGTKDQDPKSKNVWCLNLNIDMLEKVGYGGEDLTQPKHLRQVIRYLLKWFRGEAWVNGKAQQTPHIRSTLNFHRFGQTGYDKADTGATVKDKFGNDVKISDVCREYRNAIATVYRRLEISPPAGFGSLWEGNGRLAIDVPGV